jgi:hypothetical protein
MFCLVQRRDQQQYRCCSHCDVQVSFAACPHPGWLVDYMGSNTLACAFVSAAINLNINAQTAVCTEGPHYVSARGVVVMLPIRLLAITSVIRVSVLLYDLSAACCSTASPLALAVPGWQWQTDSTKN